MRAHSIMYSYIDDPTTYKLSSKQYFKDSKTMYYIIYQIIFT